MTTKKINEADWRLYLDKFSAGLDGRRAEVKVVSPKLGSQVQAEWVRLWGLAYDPKDNVLEVALEGLDHLIQTPVELYVQEGRTGIESLSVRDGEGNQHIIQLRLPVIL